MTIPRPIKKQLRKWAMSHPEVKPFDVRIWVANINGKHPELDKLFNSPENNSIRLGEPQMAIFKIRSTLKP